MQNRYGNGILPMGIVTIIALMLCIAGFFLLGIERTVINNWALAFLLLAQVVVFCTVAVARLWTAQYSGVFLNAGVASAAFIYLVVTVIGVFLVRFFDSLGRFVFMHFAIIGLFAIIVVSIFAYAGNIGRRSTEDVSKVGSKEAKRGGF